MYKCWVYFHACWGCVCIVLNEDVHIKRCSWVRLLCAHVHRTEHYAIVLFFFSGGGHAARVLLLLGCPVCVRQHAASGGQAAALHHQACKFASKFTTINGVSTHHFLSLHAHTTLTHTQTHMHITLQLHSQTEEPLAVCTMASTAIAARVTEYEVSCQCRHARFPLHHINLSSNSNVLHVNIPVHLYFSRLWKIRYSRCCCCISVQVHSYSISSPAF